MRKYALPVVVALAASLSACAGTENRGVESVHQPIVSRADYAFDAAAGPSGLAQGEAERLGGWLRSMRTGYGDRISIDEGSGYGNPAAREDVAREAARFGLLVSDTAPVTQGAVAPGTVRIVVTRSRADVPGCPDFSRVSQPNFDAHTSSNFGCAVNSNIALMVANPEDLVRGREGDNLVDPTLAARAIDSYRTREPGAKGELKQQATSSVGGGN